MITVPDGLALPVALVTLGGRALVVEVDEVEGGVLVERVSRVPVDPVDVVAVLGLD